MENRRIRRIRRRNIKNDVKNLRYISVEKTSNIIFVSYLVMNQSSLVIQDDIQRIKNTDKSTYRSLPIMTKYEFNQIIGLRAMHLAKGAIPFVETKNGIERNMALRAIALQELKEQKLPYIIKRPMPNGKAEYWNIIDLNLIAVRHLMRP
jgi:DNA-directed RNA polymerase I, II, and III subunit RPABC2